MSRVPGLVFTTLASPLSRVPGLVFTTLAVKTCALVALPRKCARSNLIILAPAEKHYIDVHMASNVYV